MYYLRTKGAAQAIQFTVDKTKLAKKVIMVFVYYYRHVSAYRPSYSGNS